VWQAERGYVVKEKLAVILLVVSGFFGIEVLAWAQTEWIRTERKDPLTDLSSVRFTLDGKFLQAPNQGGIDKPTFVLECDPSKTKWKGTVHGKLLHAFIVTGAVLDSEVVTVDSALVGPTNQSLVGVSYRRDDEKKIQNDTWEHSKNFSALFLSYHSGSGFVHDNGEMRLNQLFYGHDVIHVEGKGEQVRKIRISVPEYQGGNVVMQFDLPDLTTVADSCGLVEHKR
jgi:hypothetical protein